MKVSSATLIIFAYVATASALSIGQLMHLPSMHNAYYRLRASLFGQFDYEICEKDQNTFELKSLVINPNPPQKGKELSIDAEGYLAHDVTDGSVVQVSVAINGRPFLTRELDLCEETSKDPNAPQCPLTAGDKKITYKVQLPEKIPNFKYDVTARIIDQQNRQVLCAKASLRF
ncbi:hypothetical protein MP638_004547 [Amoeboaphelidium occidentale]|jgi:hypothetical protein|nr:hypothetical protein MP638_004547 [Amoeboaphelidium occidentale]